MYACFKRFADFVLGKPIYLFSYFLFVNLPLIFFTFNTSNWSDDYQALTLIPLKAKITPIWSIIFNPIGGDLDAGHFGPAYIFLNYLLSFFTIDPRIIHLQILALYVLTAIVLCGIVLEFRKDKCLGLLAGTLFSLNYYLAFKSISWNCFHSHAVNTLTGAVSIYFLLRYVNRNGLWNIFFSCFFLALTILNLESGFAFVPVIGIFLIWFLINRQLSFKNFFYVALAFLIVCSIYPVGSHISTKKAIPLSHRFDQHRTVQTYAFHVNELMVKSLGLSIFYNKLVFNPLKGNEELEKAVKKFLREGDREGLKQMPASFLWLLGLSGFLTAGVFLSLLALVCLRIRKDIWLFVWSFLCLFAVFVGVFYRVDIANAVSLFSSIVLADVIISLLADSKKTNRSIAIGLLSLYFAATLWTWVDRFDDCYQKSFFGISKVAVDGPDKIYREMNKQVGRYIKNGIILFTHDYSMYHETSGFDRIGDMLDLGDFGCFNATVFYKEFLATDVPAQYKDKNFTDFTNYFRLNPNYKKIIVGSKEEALEYLRNNQINPQSIDIIYLSRDYQVSKINSIE